MSEEYYNCKVFIVKGTDSSPSRTLILKRDNKHDKLYIGLLMKEVVIIKTRNGTPTDERPDSLSRQRTR